MAFRPFQDPYNSLGNLQDEFNRLMERVWHAGVSTGPFDGQQWAPVVDMYEHPDCYVVFAEMPGVKVEEVDVTYVGSTLTIRGTKRRPEPEREGGQTVRSERRYGTFCRSLELPAEIESDRLEARCRDGVLEIRLPKTETSKPKSVKIRVDE